MAAISGRTRQLSWHVVHSYSLKLFLLAAILLAVPLILWWQFEAAERQQSALLHNAVNQTGRVVAAMLRPHFAHFRSESPTALRDALQGAALVDTNVKVLVRMAGFRPSAVCRLPAAGTPRPGASGHLPAPRPDLRSRHRSGSEIRQSGGAKRGPHLDDAGE
jgi:hypothetical protein